MSSNPYHNNPVITRSNYEEYLLLYVDDELTAEEKTAIDQFLLLNPDLQQELEILMQTKLPLEWLPVNEKETLLSGSMQAKESEEALLLYVDNELNGKEKKQIEETLEKDTAYRLQYELLLKTKSDASKKVVCPFKEELYRREERKIPVLWWRIAAVVLLVVGMGTLIMTYQKQQPGEMANSPSRPQSMPSVNNTGAGQQMTTQPVDEIVMEKNNRQATPSETDGIPVKTGKEKISVVAMTKRIEKEAKNINAPVKPANVEKEDIIAVNTYHQRSIDAPVLMPEKAEDPVSKPLTKDPVTSKPLYTYNNTDATVNAVPAVADETEKSKSSLKGLLRKATRYVERRANINVTNDDEELVIGTVAISLK
ncbi:hypothetical protein OCK74_23245 [Chitinophagaceae bacterium LB-8]|uniref:Zinc-finger domain-containing protein n=1 Tax=Paraflavisolibacter caeni TaxID=2982496 RepID=A0A9X2XZ28_9BACT|nr:hypothetical protein [Paraflavisolibacter caeni]MCU7552056.1 hypothetical protein [Paraflavisolibacter caeni]